MGIARHIKKLAGYVPGEQPKSRNVVKLNTNENPYPPSPRCAKVLSSFNLDDLRRYPDPNFSALAKAIADENGTTADRVFVGNGSDEILSLAARVFVEFAVGEQFQAKNLFVGECTEVIVVHIVQAPF